MDVDVRAHNRAAWDKLVEGEDRWTVPVGPEVIARARRGVWEVLLTEQKPVPREWFPELRGADVLCLASGGGQQGPVLAAAGARVTVFDNSPKQLTQDALVAQKEGLDLSTVAGDMRDLSAFADESFDLVFHPVSNLFVPDVRPVWREAFRVLRRGGVLLAGFLNPALFIFDFPAAERGVLRVRHPLPYADTTCLTEEELRGRVERGEPLEFGHTLEDQIGGQLDAGFLVSGFYEDRHREETLGVLARYLPTYAATRAFKP